jgi:ribosomal protein L17
LPTVAKPSHAYFRDNTSPEFLAAAIQTLLDRGARTENIVVASQSFDETPIAAAAQKSGLIAACAKFGVTPTDLAALDFEKANQFEISKAVLGADLVINLAMAKIGQAGACQNLLKVLKKENYLGQKYLSSEAEIIAALEPLLDKMITIAEAENVQRSNKLTTFMGLVLAGRSSRSVDRVFSEIAQSFKMPETIKGTAIDGIPVVGRSIKEVQYQAEIF